VKVASDKLGTFFQNFSLLGAQIKILDLRKTAVCTRCALSAEYFPLRANFYGRYLFLRPHSPFL